MGWRYRRSFKLMPGVRVNVGSKGVTSFSFGGRGVSVNVGKRGTKTTCSVPGTGISYQTKTLKARHRVSAPIQVGSPGSPRSSPPFAIKALAVVGAVVFVAFLAHKPAKTPSSTYPTQVVASNASPAASSIDLPNLIAPAMAQASAPSIGPVSLSRAQRATTTTGANIRALPLASGKIVKVLSVGTVVNLGRVRRSMAARAWTTTGHPQAGCIPRSSGRIRLAALGGPTSHATVVYCHAVAITVLTDPAVLPNLPGPLGSDRVVHVLGSAQGVEQLVGAHAGPDPGVQDHVGFLGRSVFGDQCGPALRPLSSRPLLEGVDAADHQGDCDQCGQAEREGR